MADHGARIITPEAVELDLDSAGLASRLLAGLIDLAVIAMVLYGVSAVTAIGGTAVAGAGEQASIIAGLFILFATFALMVIWPAAWEIATAGRSPGKLALGLRVVTVEGAPIKVRHAVIRGLLGVVEVMMTFGVVAVAVALPSRRFRRLGDHLAGTVVVRERSGGGDAHPRRFAPVPGWEQWADRVDATRLSPDDYRVVRSYLLRAANLPPEVRSRLGHRILAMVLPRVGIDATGLVARLGAWPPEAPLTAVAAAYQDRFDAPV